MNQMNIDQYLMLKNAQLPKHYLTSTTPVVNIYQIKGLYNALMTYLDSGCVKQNAKEIINAKNILTDTHPKTLFFIYELLKSVVFEHLMEVLPRGGPNNYVYDAGTCPNACGYGRNRVVAILGNTLIKSYPLVEDVQKYPTNALVDVWQAFKSNAVAQVLGTGIDYNFAGKDCSKGQYANIWTDTARAENYGPPDNMFSTPINIGKHLPRNAGGCGGCGGGVSGNVGQTIDNVYGFNN